MADFPGLTIAYVKKRRRRIVKTRRFTVTLFAYLEANSLWEPGFCERAIRPVFLAYEALSRPCGPSPPWGLGGSSPGDFRTVTFSVELTLPAPEGLRELRAQGRIRGSTFPGR